jgi:hypothetical protein
MVIVATKVSPTSASVAVQAADAQAVRAHEKFGEAKAKLAAKLVELCKSSEREPDPGNIEAIRKEKEKVYALIFLNGLHMVVKSRADSQEQDTMMEKGLAYMEFVRSDDPEERHRELEAKAADAADLILAERDISNRTVNEFINRRLQDGISNDKLGIYRAARNDLMAESKAVSDVFMLTVKPSTLKLVRA